MISVLKNRILVQLVTLSFKHVLQDIEKNQTAARIYYLNDTKRFDVSSEGPSSGISSD